MDKITSLEELKKIELELLLAFDEFCKKNNLKYYLCGGTLLGAVRHKGFIPWDDDIDVFMPRPDYNKLLNMQIDNVVKDNFKLLKWINDTTSYPFMKLVNSCTKVREYYIAEKYTTNVWIDIFPVDGNPRSCLACTYLYKGCFFLRKLLSINTADLNHSTTSLKRILKKIFSPLSNAIGVHTLCNVIDRFASQYDFEKSVFVGGVLWGYGPQERLLKKDFLKSTTVVFEGHEFPAPSNYDTYLRNLYGDYMKLPPVEKRVAHTFEAWWIDEKECNE